MQCAKRMVGMHVRAVQTRDKVKRHSDDNWEVNTDGNSVLVTSQIDNTLSDQQGHKCNTQKK